MPLDAQRTDRYLSISQPIEFFDKSVSQIMYRIFQSLFLSAMLCHVVFIQKRVSKVDFPTPPCPEIEMIFCVGSSGSSIFFTKKRSSPSRPINILRTSF